MFTEIERAVLRVGEQMAWTNTQGYVTDELYGQLREHFDHFEIFELGMTAAALVGMGKFLLTFDLAERADNCPIHRPE